MAGLVLNTLGFESEVLLGLMNIAGDSFLLLVLLLLGMEFRVQLPLWAAMPFWPWSRLAAG